MKAPSITSPKKQIPSSKTHAESEFEKYRLIQDRIYTSDFDRFMELSNKAELQKPKDKDDQNT
jgi:hypothetical protein